MFYGFDPTFIILIPALLLTFYAQGKIQSVFSKYLRVHSLKGISGAEAARRVLNSNGLYDISIEVIPGRLTDHYDPSSRVLRLSRDVYYGDSIASIGVAAHEAGHAIQHHEGYVPIAIRNALVPVANLGSNLSWILVILGLVIRWMNLVYLGIWLFAAVVLFQVITLPVEFNASSRALKQLKYVGILYEGEVEGAKKVLDAAALTYVAAVFVAISQLIRLLLIARDRD
ncbi:zinc metallopeptidase [Caloramator sp. E03]|uniref:zinc metallopeptidase n=1 Tax=Caloramator sp. E03 TaxID=2576307 RepID=UPI0011100F65|nr:zinc metallopeptidase [Caloramator sp. E03]QCX32218.1 zinc metallopeptidase [Caloramator sp. E03]